MFFLTERPERTDAAHGIRGQFDRETGPRERAAHVDAAVRRDARRNHHGFRRGEVVSRGALRASRGKNRGVHQLLNSHR